MQDVASDTIKRALVSSGVSVSTGSRQLGISRQQLYNLLHGRARLTVRLAVRLESLLGVDAGELLRAQLQDDLMRERAEA